MTTTTTPVGTVMITIKQFKFIKSLIADRDWSAAHPTVSIAIRKLRNIEWDGSHENTPDVARTTASKTIDFLLSPLAPKSVAPHTTTAASTAVSGAFGNIKTEALALLNDIPGSYKGCKYVIKNSDPNAANQWVFYEVREVKGTKYLNRLQGAPGTWTRIFVKYTDYAGIVQRIQNATFISDNVQLTGPKAAAWKFADIFQRCSACGAPLTNNVSIAQAMGPICIKKF